jgi:3-isopropylmalate dehydrogenase
LLDHLGQADAAARVTAAVSADLAARGTQPRATADVGDAIVTLLTTEFAPTR